jgi:hypothetical protein
MAYLTKTITAADASRLTYSAWFRIPNPDYDNYLADRAAAPFSTQYNLFDIEQSVGVAITHKLRLSWTTTSGGRWRFQFDAGDRSPFDYDAQKFNSLALPTSSIVANTWYHFLLAVLTEGDHVAQRCFFFLNRVNCCPLVVWSGFPDQPAGTWDSWHTPSGSGGYPEIINALATFDMSLNGGTFNAPSRAASEVGTGGNGRIILSNVQLWIGIYIDPTVSANLDKLVTVADGFGKPTPSSEAADAFGQQSILCEGGDKTFHINAGNEGDLTKVGTITNFSSPKYVVV